eukprot:m.172202 g.172202  ORF g.172202 m.172202 type:complete len:86 (+) comp31672_c9_seq1:4242-4499(+)
MQETTIDISPCTTYTAFDGGGILGMGTNDATLELYVVNCQPDTQRRSKSGTAFAHKFVLVQSNTLNESSLRTPVADSSRAGQQSQ